MKRGFALLVILALSLLALAFIPVLAAADADSKLPSVPLVSSFAPADDLLDQFDFYTKRIEEGLASKSDFDDAAKSRLKKDANTLAALSLMLGMHDADHRFKASAGELLKAALTKSGGRGGGSPTMAQGSLPSADGIDALLGDLGR